MVSLIVVLAVYVSFGRLLMSNVETYHAQILQHLNSRMPFHIEAQKVGGQLRSFSPEIVLSGLRISIPGSDEPPIVLEEGRISFHPLQSLTAGLPQVTKLRLDGLRLQGERGPDGNWTIRGIGGGDSPTAGWLEEFLLNIERVDLINNSVKLDVVGEQSQTLTLDLALRRQGSERRLEANIRSVEHNATITAIARGVGNPLRQETFSGQLYFDVDAQNIAPFQALLKTPPPINISGGVDTQIWLAMNTGEFSVEFTFDGQNLEASAADDSWHFPMQGLSMQAQLINDKEHWTVDASDMRLRKGDTILKIPRVNLVSRGDSLHVLAAAVPLDKVNALLVDMALTPDAIADVFTVLNTRGQLNALQIDMADISQPQEDWHVAANFQDLQVDSWRGAPALTNGNGYVSLSPGSGQVIIDSQLFEMHYPTVYRDPLAYDDFFGTIGLSWDGADFTLSSGLMTATAREGVAKVLFGLNIPLASSPVGLEMDLLVGLQDFDPSYRDKYLPYTLSEGLLGWLKPSIEQGTIEQGAFLWRGSLTPNRPNQKTVQLFFNVADTTLDYHSDWPPVTELDGTVLIDDARVSVWSSSAKLYASTIRQLSAETWLDKSGQMMLAIDGYLSGDAADGIRVVNESPLSELVGGTFTRWSLAGGLDTHVELALSLGSETKEPSIAVETRWREVDLFIEPGGIPLNDVSGQLTYSTDQGFGSADLTASLWGQPVDALVRQTGTVVRSVVDDAAVESFDDEQSAILVDLSTRVTMSDVQSWLNLDAIELAQGTSDVGLELNITPGRTPQLTVDSALLGVGLDLPPPWGKAADQNMPLHIEASLAKDGVLTQLILNNSLYLDTQLDQGSLGGMNLSFYRPPKPIQLGLVGLSGHLPSLDVAQWDQFVKRYIGGEVLGSLGQTQEFSVQVDALQVDTLQVAGQDLRDVMLDLKPVSDGWRLSAETDWIAGQFWFAHETDNPTLNIQYLDVSQLGKLNFSDELFPDNKHDDSQSSVDVVEAQATAQLMVTVDGISRGPEQLGSVSFTLLKENSVVQAQNINGQFLGLRLNPEQPASMVWDTEANFSRVNAWLDFEDLGATLERLGYQKTLETEDGQLQLALEWPGGPQQFSLAEASGSLDATTGGGRFLNAPAGASGALRVVSILNLADIIGKVSLSHMFESGVSFHGIAAQLFLQDAKVEVAKMDVEGNSSGFQFTGVADLPEKTLDGSLVVVLPVANNLPWVVALTAGLPVAAGVFVVSQVFKEQVNRFSSGVYQISGPWADPKVEFLKIFDDSAKKKQPSSPSSSAEPTAPQGTVDQQAIDPNAPQLASDPNSPAVLSST